MHRDRRRTFLLAAASIALSASAAPGAQIALRPQYEIRATVSLDPPVVEGTVTVLFTNHSNRTLTEVAVMLFPNRFTQEGDIDDLARPMIHPREEFVPGGKTLHLVRDGDRTPMAPPQTASAGDTVVRIPITALEPAATRRMQFDFRTKVPHRFGGFGEFDRQITLLGGWHPYLAALDDDGTWLVDDPPPVADFRVTLTPAETMHIVSSGHLGTGDAPLHVFAPAVPYVSLVAAPRLLRATRRIGDTTVTLLVRPKRFSHRVVVGLDEPGLILATLERVLAERPEGIGPPPAQLLLVEAPLRLHLIEPGEGMVVFSDRTFQVLGPLRDFHAAHLAQVVYQEMMRPVFAARESPRDHGWVAEGVSDEMARRFMDARQPDRRLLSDWVNMFAFLAAVDRFEKVPKIAFVSSYFDQVATADPAGDRILTFNHDRPPGRVILSKLRDLVGEEAFRSMFDDCLRRPLPLRRCAAEHFPDRGIEELIDDWNAPYPVMNFWVDSVDFNRPDPAGFRTTAELRRETSRPVTQPVTVRLRAVGGGEVDVQWDSQGGDTTISQTTDRRVYRVQIDPGKRLIETRRDDNAWLPRFEFLIDSADIEVSSTEFGFGATGVARIYQDYRRDIGVTGFYTNRGVGMAVGPRFHFGPAIDPTLFRHNLYLFYSLVALDSSFDNPAQPDVRDHGNTASLGFRYDYTDVFFDQNPSLQRRFRIHADWHDDAIGSDFDFATWGYEASLIFPLRTPRTLLGLQVVNGFSSGIDGGEVPVQALYSLGGARSIRGIGFGEQLGRNLLVLRSEIRQSIYPELNWNLQDILILRRTQVRFFAETGNVANAAGRVYDASDWAVGIGAGLGLIYDAAGFIPAVAYLEIATRVDDRDSLGDIQILFGTKQPF